MTGQISMWLLLAGAAVLGFAFGSSRGRAPGLDDARLAVLEERASALEDLAQAHGRRLRNVEDGQDVLDARLCDLQDGACGEDSALRKIEERMDGLQTVYDEQFRVLQKACAVGPVERRVDALERRTAGVEALLVSTVGQETEDFCRKMDGLIAKMDAPKAEREPAGKWRGGKRKEAQDGR